MTYNLNQKSLIHTLKEQLKNNKNKSLKNIIIELHLAGQYPYVKGIYELLSNQANLAVYFSLLDEEFYNIKNHLSHFGITDDKLIFASTVPSLEWIDLFISPTNWTTFIPKGNIPKIQLFHSLIYKNTIFAGQFNDFNHIFFPGQHHKDYYSNEYIKNFPHLAKTQKTFDIGYPKLDEVINGKINRDQVISNLGLDSGKPTVLYAPTWELTASLHTKGLQIIDALAGMDINVLIKLHPMSYRDPKFTFASGGIDWKAVIASIEKKYKNVKNILDPDANPYIVASDLMVTDASGVGLEFMTTNKPLVFIDVPEFFKNCGYGGIEDKCRVAGEIVKDIGNLKSVIEENLRNSKKYEKQRKKYTERLLFNSGHAAEKATEKILHLLENFEKTITNREVDLLNIEKTKKIVQKVDGYLTDEEGELLYTLAKNCKGKGAIVEIGSWKGKSAIWLGKGSKAGNKVKVYAIDPHMETPAHQRHGLISTFEEFKNNIKYAQVDDIITPITKPSSEAAKDFNEPIEVIFIDGDHEYESAKQDFDLWLPKMVEGGTILLHDSAGPNAWPGVKKFVNELVSESKNVRNAMVADSITYVEVGESFSIKVKNAINAGRADIQKGLTSIIVIALNGLDYTKRCIESIRKYTKPSYELIVVDNGSTDGTLEYLKAQKDIKLITNDENVGAPFARNQGLQIASGEYIVFLDNDVVVTRNWLDILISYSRNNHELGLIGPMSNYVSGPQYVPDSNFEDLDAIHKFAGKFSLKNREKLSPANRLILFAMFAKRDVIEKIGGFDPLYGKWGFEDDDYCIRALIAGYKLAIAEDVFIYHKGSSTSVSANIDYNKLLEENWENFKKKWGLPQYLSYIQGYPINIITNQPFNKEKHYCSLTERMSSLEIISTHHGDLSSFFTKSTIDGLSDNHKEQFLLFNIADECEGNVLEVGYRNIHLSAMIAVSGLNVTRLTSNSIEEKTEAGEFYLSNLEIEEGSLSRLSADNKSYDDIVLYFDENTDSQTIGKAFKSAKSVVKSTGKIIVACKTNYQTKTEIKSILDKSGNGNFSEVVPSPYILACFEGTGAGEEHDIVITNIEKPSSFGLVSIVLAIDDKTSNQDANDLSNCINRIYSQTYSDIELTICNLSKRSEIKDVLKAYQGKYKYIESSKKVNEAVELAINHTEGNFIVILTPSDLLLPKAIEIRMNALGADHSCDSVSTDSINFLERLDGVRLRWNSRSLYGGKAVQEQLIGNRIHTAASILKKSSLLRKNLFSKDYGEDFYYGFWLNFFASGLRIKNINIPTVFHKLTKFEEYILQTDIDILDNFSQIHEPNRKNILKNFIKDYPITVLLPNKKMIDQKGKFDDALYAFRSSVLIQNCLYSEALHDLTYALKRIPTDIGVRNDIKELITFLLMKSIELNDNLLLAPVAKLLKRIDNKNSLANLHLIRLKLEKYFHNDQPSVSKIKEILSQLVGLHPENKFNPYQFLCYGYLACLSGNQEIADKMFGKALNMNIALPVIGTAMKMSEQYALRQTFADNNRTKEIIENLKYFVQEKSLSLVMIVKNEEEYLERCLRSVDGIVDEIVIVDTGSTDRTIEIAKSFNAKIIHHKWKDDFSEARNVSIENATGDWVMYLDGDEELTPESRELIKDLISDVTYEGFQFVINNFVGERATEDFVINVAIRMWRNRPQNRFYGALHEQIIDRIQKNGPTKSTNVQINHYGYLNKPTLEKSKSERNLQIVQKMVNDEPDNAFNHFSLGLEYARLADWENAHLSFEKAAEILGENKEPYYAHVLALNRVRSLRNLGRIDDTLALIERLHVRYSAFPDLYLNKALVLSDANKFVEAIKVLKDLTNLNVDYAKYATQSGINTFRPYYMLGRVHEHIGDEKQAVYWYSKVLKTNNTFFENVRCLVQLLLASESEKDVEDFLLKYINTEDKYSLYEIGVIFLENKHPKIALKYLNKAAQMDFQLPHINFYLGKAKMMLKEYDEALNYFSKIIKTSEDYLPARIEAIAISIIKRDFKKAIDTINELPNINPYDSYKTVFKMMVDVLSVGKFDKTKFNENEAKFSWEVINKFIQLGCFELFEQTLKLTANLTIDEGLIALNLGKIYYENGFDDLAAEQFMKALQKGYCDSESLAILGDVCIRKNLIEDAINFYTYSINSDPPKINNFIKLVQLLMKDNQTVKAKEVFEKAAALFPESEVAKQASKILDLIAVNNLSEMPK